MFGKSKKESVIFAPEMDVKLVAQAIVERFQGCPAIKDMKTADRYFGGHNEAIERKTRVYYDKDGNRYDNPAVSNAKIKSSFLRVLVQQKQDYALSKTFVLKLSDENGKEIKIEKSDYGMAWKKFCDDTLFKAAYSLAGNAVNRGMAWLYIWIDEEGDFKIQEIPATLVFPVWEDRAHTKLDRLVYNYTIERYDDSKLPEVKEYAEYWSDHERALFCITDNWIEKNEDDKNKRAQMTNGEDIVSWGRVPFICLKGTNDEKPLLNFVKEQIDNYDALNSRSVDGLIDDLDPLLVMKGVSSQFADIQEARELMKMTRTVSLDSDGDAHFIQAQTQTQAYAEKMEVLRRDIIKFGYGIDFEDARFSGNPNQLVIKSLYQNLDTYTDGLERHFQDFIDGLKYFFDKWWELSKN
ncbi:MAG: phage portal protein, partial [Lachnospiraceae bacterium]|nr:phage portal protein [Lachnospiraceae bacterium]